LGGMGGTGGVFGGITPPDCPGGGALATAIAADTPGGGGGSGKGSPQFWQTRTSSGLTVSHFGHLFSHFFAAGGRKHMVASPFLVKQFSGKYRKQNFPFI
jgi:hypothetical protein